MTEVHIPKRGSDVAEWLKRQRDEYSQGSPEWRALNLTMDDYRIRADYGRTLARDTECPR